MQITELNVTMWPQLRRDAARVSPAPAPAPAVVASLNVLDADRDGWLDEDDLPYDQLVLLQRERADAAKPAPGPVRVEAEAGTAPDRAAPPVAAGPAAHIDLFA